MPSLSAARPNAASSPAPSPNRFGSSRPVPSDGSFMKSSSIVFAARSGCAAVETRPASVMLTFWTYAAGCVRL